MTIIDHTYNKLYKKRKQLTHQLENLNKEEGKEPEKNNTEKQLIQAEKKLGEYLKERENGYPTCAFCSQKVAPSCLMVAGCPRNYHNECWVKVKEEIKKEKEHNPFLFAKVENLERELAEIKKSLHK